MRDKNRIDHEVSNVPKVFAVTFSRLIPHFISIFAAFFISFYLDVSFNLPEFFLSNQHESIIGKTSGDQFRTCANGIGAIFFKMIIINDFSFSC